MSIKVELINHMGTDLTVVNAARVEASKESYIKDDVYGILENKDEKLIKFMAKHNHFTPFTHCVITLRETVPIFVARQRFKHTVGFSYNEVSRRYVDYEPEFYIPKTWRKRSPTRKQGSLNEPVEEPLYNRLNTNDCRTTAQAYERFIEYACDFYTDLINHGVAPEQARMVLPQSMFTSYYVTGSLLGFARAYNLRHSTDAQQEIQDLSSEWDRILKPLYPISWRELTNQ